MLDKNVMCGLFDSWGGGGSILEIEGMTKDIKIPFKCVHSFCVDGCKQLCYDVDEVYGLIGSCWTNALKEIVKEE